MTQATRKLLGIPPLVKTATFLVKLACPKLIKKCACRGHPASLVRFTGGSGASLQTRVQKWCSWRTGLVLNPFDLQPSELRSAASNHGLSAPLP